MRKLTPTEATERGLVIARSCYPWVAYRGPRFHPTELRECLTEKEAALLDVLRSTRSQMNAAIDKLIV